MRLRGPALGIRDIADGAGVVELQGSAKFAPRPLPLHIGNRTLHLECKELPAELTLPPRLVRRGGGRIFNDLMREPELFVPIIETLAQGNCIVVQPIKGI